MGLLRLSFSLPIGPGLLAEVFAYSLRFGLLSFFILLVFVCCSRRIIAKRARKGSGEDINELLLMLKAEANIIIFGRLIKHHNMDRLRDHCQMPLEKRNSISRMIALGQTSGTVPSSLSSL